MDVILKRVLFIAVALLIAPLVAVSALASHYDYDYADNAYRSYPIYRTGEYHNSYAYGYSGWDYHRIYYRYHYPYSTSWYGGYGGGGHNHNPDGFWEKPAPPPRLGAWG